MIRTQSKWRKICLSSALDSKVGLTSSSFLAMAFLMLSVPFSGYPCLLSAISPTHNIPSSWTEKTSAPSYYASVSLFFQLRKVSQLRANEKSQVSPANQSIISEGRSTWNHTQHQHRAQPENLSASLKTSHLVWSLSHEHCWQCFMDVSDQNTPPSPKHSHYCSKAWPLMDDNSAVL